MSTWNDMDAVAELRDKKIRPGRWGAWIYIPSTFVLQLGNRADPIYEVDLDRCGSSAAILDWVVQVQSKTWCTAEDIYFLLEALNDLFVLQANVCSCGKEKVFNPRELVKKNRARRAERKVLCNATAE